MNNTTIYNMYSSGEDVLRNLNHDEGNLTDITAAWGCQEKLKGRMPLGYLVGSTKGGWGFNQYNYGAYTNSSGTPGITWYAESPAVAENITPTNLITKPFFKYTDIRDLFNTNSATAQAYAANNYKDLIARAIPARTFATGANAVGDSIIQYNANMNEEHQTGWPRAAGEGEERPRWYHSDIKNVGYLYNYEAYNYIVENGGLDSE